MKSSVLALGALTVCVLAACGGGGGDSSSAESAAQVQADPALAKYVGTWESCDPNGAGSQRSRARVLSVQGDTATAELDAAFFDAPACAGAPSFDLTAKGTAKLVGGTKSVVGQPTCQTVSGQTRCTTLTLAYDKALLTYTGFTLRAGSLDFAPPMPNATTPALIAVGADGKFYFGRGSRDTDGYPKQISPIALTKRP